MNKTIAIITVAAGMAGLTPAPLAAVPRTVEHIQDTPLPEIWQEVPANQRLQYVRAAEIDATRLLAERIAGIALDGETTVRELAAADETIKGAMDATLKGVRTTGGPTFCEDGRVEVVRAVNLESVIKFIVEKTGCNSVTTFKTVKETIDALGAAAIPGSLGYKHVLSKRAAEVDVYRRLAERLVGVKVDAETTLRDCAVQDDEVKSILATGLKSAEITTIAYNADGTAAVTAKLRVGPLVRTIERKRNSKGQMVTVSDKTDQMVLEETGHGAPKGDAPAEGSASISSEEVETIIAEVISRTPIL